VARGFGDTCAATIRADLAAAGVTQLRDLGTLAQEGALPGWLEDEAVLRSHRSALVRKEPAHYAALFPGVPTDLPYVWPVRSEAVLERERRQAEAALRRQERAREKARRARSAAGRKGWQTRRRRLTDPQQPQQLQPE
jgi:hypothetical protein